MEDARWGGGHGVFTYFALKGLEGRADSNRDGTPGCEIGPKQVGQIREGSIG